jgi:hypothetical protein
VIQYVDGHFVDSYLPTIENTFYKRVMFRSEDIDIAIRDTTGQDEVTVFHPRNCLGVHGYILVFSVTSKYSFEIVKFINDKRKSVGMGEGHWRRCLPCLPPLTRFLTHTRTHTHTHTHSPPPPVHLPHPPPKYSAT